MTSSAWDDLPEFQVTRLESFNPHIGLNFDHDRSIDLNAFHDPGISLPFSHANNCHMFGDQVRVNVGVPIERSREIVRLGNRQRCAIGFHRLDVGLDLPKGRASV